MRLTSLLSAVAAAFGVAVAPQALAVQNFTPLGVCPTNVILAARGTQHKQIEPTCSSLVEGCTSNGWKSNTIHDF